MEPPIRIMGSELTPHQVAMKYKDLPGEGDYAHIRLLAKAYLEIEDDDELTSEEYLEKYGEPRGAGADPFGRPDPRTHPEYWTE